MKPTKAHGDGLGILKEKYCLSAWLPPGEIERGFQAAYHRVGRKLRLDALSMQSKLTIMDSFYRWVNI